MKDGKISVSVGGIGYENTPPFEKGIPAHDTIARVVSHLAPEALNTCFVKWMNETEKLTETQVIFIDDKTLQHV